MAQNGTAYYKKQAEQLFGHGSRPIDKTTIEKLCKAKFTTQGITARLIGYAQRKGDKEMEHGLWNAYRCGNTLLIHDNRIYTRYCKNRFCIRCCNIRKADLINSYKATLQKWDSPHFVTLTVRNCKKNNLKALIEKMLETLSTILQKHKKRHQRGKGDKLMGLRTMECTFNPGRLDYHPHFHILVNTQRAAETLVVEWLEAWPDDSLPCAQDITRVNDLNHHLSQLIKYGTKLYTEEKPAGKTRKAKGIYKIYFAALYNIIDAFRGLRLIERFGFNNVDRHKPERPASRLTIDYAKCEYTETYRDWLDIETGNPLFSFVFPDELIDMLVNKIDRHTE